MLMSFNYFSVSALIIIALTLTTMFVANILFPTVKISKRIAISTFWLIPVIGAILLILFQDISFETIIVELSDNHAVNPLKVIAIFFSMTFISIFLDEIGFFSFIANKLAKKLASNQFKLFIGLYVTISLLTIFTSNDIVILTFTPFIIYYAKHAKIDPFPYLMMEFISANTMSMMLIIGNPTNIYLASAFNIDFITYFKSMIIPTLIASIVSFLILFGIFFKKLKQPMTICEESVKKPNTLLLIVGLSILLITTVTLAISSYVNIEMWIVALCGAGIEIVFVSIYSIITKDNLIWRSIKHIPFNLVFFILSMFIIVITLKQIGLTSVIGDFLYSLPNVFSFGLSGALSANLINNIPMSILYANILNETNLGAIYASIASSNIAAYISPLGALAGLMFISLCKKNNIKISFLRFSAHGSLVALPTLILTLIAIHLLIK